MAGSFAHVHDPSKPDGFRFDLIENMGDAHEACEDMHAMILLLCAGDEQKLRKAEREMYEIARGEYKMPDRYVRVDVKR